MDYENILEKKNLTELNKTYEKRRCNTDIETTQWNCKKMQKSFDKKMNKEVNKRGV